MEKQNQTDTENAADFADARVLNDLTGIDRQLMERINTFLRTHVLKVDFSEGRGGGGGGLGGNKGGAGGGGKNKYKRRYQFYLWTDFFINNFKLCLTWWFGVLHANNTSWI